MNRCRPLSLIAYRVSRAAFCVLLTAFCLLPSAFGQSATATLSGTVLDPNGAVVPTATITVTEVATGVQRNATTNDQGYFNIPLLKPSTYLLQVEHQGFLTAEVRDIILNVGADRALRIQMKVGDVKETVNITGEAPLINESPAVGTVVDRQFVANIPLNGRSFQSLLTLTPGVVLMPGANNSFAGQFSVNGQRPNGNAFTVDGVSANFAANVSGASPGAQTSGNLPGLTAFGTTQSLVSVDALEEFKVQTSTYSAEYGRQPGGQISIITRSGTNQFHGSVFDYLRNNVFDANDWFANANSQPRPPERQNDFGGTFSGPVLLPRFGEGGRQPGYNGRNRTFFFFSYEGLRLRLPQFALTNVPSLALRQQAPPGMQPIVNAFPVPNGRDLGTGLAEFSASYSDPSTLNATSIRIDHTLNRKLTLFGRYNQAPSESDTRSTSNLNIVASKRVNTKTLTLALTATLTPRLSNEFKVNYSDNGGALANTQGNFGGATPLPRTVLIPSQYDSIAAVGQVNFLLPGQTASSFPLLFFFDGQLGNQRQFNIVDNLSYEMGAHQLKFGIDYRRLTPVYTGSPYYNLEYFFTAQSVLSATPGFSFIQAGLPAKPLYMNLSAYGQDTWKASRRLTFDLGLRWEVNPAPSEANGNNPLAVTQIDNLATMQLAPRGTSQWKTTYNNFAPRIGVAYQLRQEPGRETVVRGGFGVYYDIGNDISSYAFGSYPFVVSGSVSNVTFPLSPSQVAPPPIPALQASLTPPYGSLVAFDPALKLPYTLQWNVAVEQSLGQSQVLTASYLGAAGRRLVQSKSLNIGPINPSFTTVLLTTNKATSDYDALQAQFQRRLSKGLQTLVSYTWSHAIDEDSSSFGQVLPLRGNSAFDVRHNFAAAITYDIPSLHKNRLAAAVLGRWSVDSSIHAQSALPVDLIGGTFVDPATGTRVNRRPNLITGVPIYLYGSQYPGGRILNNTVPTAAQVAAAGCAPLTATNAKGAFCTPPAGQSGNFGRNQVRGLPAWQVDFAVRRQFKLSEKLNLQFRAEAFNLFNHPNFGTIQTALSAANFGQATNMLNRQLGGVSQLYQIGGPRSFQFALKLIY